MKTTAPYIECLAPPNEGFGLRLHNASSVKTSKSVRDAAENVDRLLAISVLCVSALSTILLKAITDNNTAISAKGVEVFFYNIEEQAIYDELRMILGQNIDQEPVLILLERGNVLWSHCGTINIDVILDQIDQQFRT